ncbi:ABC transporter substrate-binding protein [Streptomyces decoyicus]
MTTLNASTRRNFLTLLGLSAVAVSCGTAATGASSGKGQTKTLRYQGWAGQVTLPELAEDLGYLKDVKLKWVGNTTSGPQDIQSAATGQIDFGGSFNGAVVKLAANEAPIKAVISYYGSDKDAYNGYYVLGDSPIRSARDLIGKKVGMNTLGAHAEALLDIHLERGGLSPGQVGKVEPLVVPPVNTEQSLRRRQIEVAVLGGILRDKALAKGASAGCSPTTNCSAPSAPARM